MLMRVGGGEVRAPLDPARHGRRHPRPRPRQDQRRLRATAAPALAIKTVEQYLGIDVNHIVEVNFENFPAFIDALGGINYTGGCVVSSINGGFKNGGYTLRLHRGTHQLDGKQALALARTRKNECNTARERPHARARASRRSCRRSRARLTQPETFVRLPWVSWAGAEGDPLRHGRPGAARPLRRESPPAARPPTRVLPGVPEGNGLTVPDAVKQREVRRFLKG